MDEKIYKNISIKQFVDNILDAHTWDHTIKLKLPWIQTEETTKTYIVELNTTVSCKKFILLLGRHMNRRRNYFLVDAQVKKLLIRGLSGRVPNVRGDREFWKKYLYLPSCSIAKQDLAYYIVAHLVFGKTHFFNLIQNRNNIKTHMPIGTEQKFIKLLRKVNINDGLTEEQLHNSKDYFQDKMLLDRHLRWEICSIVFYTCYLISF